MSFSEANLKEYIEGMGMDTYTILNDVYTSDDDPRAEDLKNCLVIGMNAVPTTPQGNNIWENVETYRLDLYHAQFLSVNRIRELLQKYPGTQPATLADLGFETGVDGFVNEAGSNPASSSDFAHVGSKSLKLVAGGVTSRTSLAVSTPTQVIWYWYFPDVSGDTYYVLLRDGDYLTNHVFCQVAMNINAVASDPAPVQGYSGSAWVATGVTVASGTWYKFELRTHDGAIWYLYIDDVLAYTFPTTAYTADYVVFYTQALGTKAQYIDTFSYHVQPWINLDYLEKSIRPRQPVYYGRMKNGMHHWAMTFDIMKTVEVT